MNSFRSCGAFLYEKQSHGWQQFDNRKIGNVRYDGENEEKRAHIIIKTKRICLEYALRCGAGVKN
jgi:hypothetical protein